MKYRNEMLILAFSAMVTASVVAQTTASPIAATAATAVPTLVRYSGVALGSNGQPRSGQANITFLIYKDDKGGDPLWVETQVVQFDPVGRYEVHLGAMSASGLPTDLFSNGEARWLEVQVAGSVPAPRVLLASVPYALNAATLGGLPASAFVLAGSQVAALAAAGATSAGGSVTSDTNSTVTTTGGTSHYLPLFTGTSTIANSEIYDTGSSVGIGDVPASSAKLDVKGAIITRGSLTLSPTSTANASHGYSSFGADFSSSVYNSSTKTAATPFFQLQSEPVSNNTSNPSATFNLLYAAPGKGPAETGLSINSTGVIHFASGQTFPGGGGSGITKITAASPLTGGGTTGNVTIGLSASALETTLSPIYAQLKASNYFTSSATFAGPITGNSGNTMYAIQGNTSSGFGVEGMATGTDGYGIDGYTTGNGGVGVYGNSDGGADSNGNYPIGVLAHALEGFGMKSVVDEPMDNYAAVLGLNGGGSSTYSYLKGFEDVSAGVWGDGTDNNNVSFSIGIVGTAETSYGGYFLNNSVNNPTVYATNENAGGSGLFKTLMATSPQGTCGVGGGSLTCTGQVKSLATTASGSHQVETYAMQSPENWMEDFGTGTLSGGTGIVTIDATFAETVSESADYHVFLTPRGDSKGLYVTNLTPTSFEVHESGAGTASIAFDYRIVAKRRGLETQRLTDVTERFQAEMKASKLVKQAVKK